MHDLYLSFMESEIAYACNQEKYMLEPCVCNAAMICIFFYRIAFIESST